MREQTRRDGQASIVALVYEPGVRSGRVDSILSAAIYRAEKLEDTRAKIEPLRFDSSGTIQPGSF